MAAPTPSTHYLSTHRALITTLTSFLTVCTHHIIFLRHLYAPATFLSARAYNYPVRQSRHPAVCTWINDAIAAISDQLFKNTVSAVSLCIFELEGNTVLERWTFNLLSFPSVAKRDRDVPFATPDDFLATKVNMVDLEATFRATLSRITSSATRLKPLPTPPSGPECSFTLTIEVSPTADRPVGLLDGEERKWIVAEPQPNPNPETDAETKPSAPTTTSHTRPNNADDQTRDHPAKPTTATATTTTAANPNQPLTHPIRRLSTHPLHIELYVTESAHKKSYTTPHARTPAVRAAEMSYGAGTRRFETGQRGAYNAAGEGGDADGDAAHSGERVRFDVEEGYDDIEGTDVNRKPAAGRGMEY